MTRDHWKAVLQKNWNVVISNSFAPYHVSLTLCQISEHLQDSQLTKFLGQFIELHKNYRKFDLRQYCSLSFLQHFQELRVTLTPESIYMEEEHGLKKHTVHKSQKIRTSIILLCILYIYYNTYIYIYIYIYICMYIYYRYTYICVYDMHAYILYIHTNT